MNYQLKKHKQTLKLLNLIKRKRRILCKNWFDSWFKTIWKWIIKFDIFNNFCKIITARKNMDYQLPQLCDKFLSPSINLNKYWQIITWLTKKKKAQKMIKMLCERIAQQKKIADDIVVVLLVQTTTCIQLKLARGATNANWKWFETLFQSKQKNLNKKIENLNSSQLLKFRHRNFGS